MLKLKASCESALHISLQVTCIAAVKRHTKKLRYLFIKGKVPSLLRLWFGPGVVRFAGSENMILNIVHVVETFLLNKRQIYL